MGSCADSGPANASSAIAPAIHWNLCILYLLGMYRSERRGIVTDISSPDTLRVRSRFRQRTHTRSDAIRPQHLVLRFDPSRLIGRQLLSLAVIAPCADRTHHRQLGYNGHRASSHEPTREPTPYNGSCQNAHVGSSRLYESTRPMDSWL